MKKIILTFYSFCLLLSAILIAAINHGFGADSANKHSIYSNIGFSCGLTLNHHSADMRQAARVPGTITNYATGSSVGFDAGIFYEFHLGSKFWLLLRAFYSQNNAEVTTDNTVRETVNGKQQDMGVTEKMKADLSGFKLEPLAKFALVENLYFLGGFFGGLRFSSELSHEQIIRDSKTGSFADGSSSRKIKEETGSGMKYLAALTGGLSYDISLSGKRGIALALEVLYSHGLAVVRDDFTWDINSIRGGIQLKYSPFKPVPVEKVPERQLPPIPPPVPVLPPPPVAEIKPVEPNPEEPQPEIYTTVYSTENGNDIKLDTVVAEEFISNNTQPLLNYIFFDSASSHLPDRYRQITKENARYFRADFLFDNPTLPTYYHILNIIGSRLKINPSASLIITGCNSNFGAEKGNTELSEKRAEEIGKYLADTWQIDQSRLKIKSRNLPEKPSNINNPEGIAENRRVELTSDNPEILYPLETNRIIKLIKPGKIHFKTKYSGIKEFYIWQLIIRHKSDVIKVIQGQDSIPEAVYWNVNQDSIITGNISDSLIYSFQVLDMNRRIIVGSDGKINVKLVRIIDKKLNQAQDKRIDIYSLVLFDFDDASISSFNQKILNFTVKKLEKGSSINIEGFTDKIGEESHNLTLSKRRADATAKYIRTALSGKNEINAEGFGNSVLLYDNTHPEGRFYSRTVRITVETPINK